MRRNLPSGPQHRVLNWHNKETDCETRTIMTIPTNMLNETFAVLGPELAIKPVKVTPSFYTDLDANFNGFKDHVLVSSYDFSEDWSTWEKHPAGDEMVMLLSGSATLILRTPDGDESVALSQPGSYVVVPRDTWHTARVADAAKMLFITPGEGTENRELPPATN